MRAAAMACVASPKDKHALAGEIGGVHGTRIPGQARGRHVGGGCVNPRDLADFGEKRFAGANADGNAADGWLLEASRQPVTGGAGDLRVEADIGVGLGQSQQILRAGAEGGDDIDVDADAVEQFAHFPQIVAASEAQGAGSQEIHLRTLPGAAFKGLPRCRYTSLQQGAHQRVEGLAGAPVFLARVGEHFDGHHGNRQPAAARQGPGLVLQQFGGAGIADQKHLGLFALAGGAQGRQHQIGGIAAQVAGPGRWCRLPAGAACCAQSW